jgi:DNA ligase (NAD+)
VRQVEREELAAIHSIGEIIADKVIAGLAARSLLIDRLLQHVQIAEPEPASAAGGALAGQSFVFTGKLLSCDRRQAQTMVKDHGGEAPGGVTRDLTYLVIGDGKEGKKSSKQLKAEKYIAEGAGIRIITETEFLRILGD